MNKLGAITTAITIAVASIAVVASVIATPSQKQLSTADKALTVKILHEGISMALEIALEDKQGYLINRMIKKGNAPWVGVVIAKSGHAYKASCEINSVMGEKFALPCDLTEITTK